MAFSEEYADRVRMALRETTNVHEQKMFGSLGFMVNGHLTLGVGDGKDGSVIMVRVGKDSADDYLDEPGASTSVMGNKMMHGWIDLTPEAVANDESLKKWVARSVQFVETLPPKGQ